MKTITTALLIIVLLLLPVSECSAPPMPPTQEFSAVVAIVLVITVVAVAGTAIYVIIKCAKKLNRPPTIESSTNRVDWSTSGQMTATTDGYQWSEAATNAVMFYRAKQ